MAEVACRPLPDGKTHVQPFNYMSSKWYPEGYTYPTMPIYIRGTEGSNSSGTCKGVPSPPEVIRTPTAGDSKKYADRIKTRMYPTRHSERDLVDGVNYFKVRGSLPPMFITQPTSAFRLGKLCAFADISLEPMSTVPGFLERLLDLFSHRMRYFPCSPLCSDSQV